MTHPDFVIARYDRARQQADNLIGEIAGFAKSKGHRVIHEQDPDGLEHRFRMFFDPRPDLVRWGILLGEVFHNLRAVLDNRVCELVRNNRCEPTKRTEFPIFLDAGRFAKEAGQKMNGLSEPVREVIEKMQPYHAGDKAKTDSLWLLHEINNTDKHHVVLPVVVSQHGATIYSGNPSHVYTPADRIEHGAVVLTVTTTAPGDEVVHVKARGLCQIAVEVAGLTFSLGDVLSDIGEDVGVVLENLRRIKVDG